MKMPLVSICIPVYNGRPWLNGCITNALNQRHGNVEVIVVDDCSSDYSFEVASSLASYDSRIRVYRNKRRLGLVANWNECIGYATGQWVKLLFQDDVIDEDFTFRCIMEATAPLVITERKLSFDGSMSESTKAHWESFVAINSIIAKFTKFDPLDPKEFCLEVAKQPLVNFIGEPTAALIHSSVFDRLGYFNEELIQLADWEFWVRVASNFGMHYIPVPLATYHIHKKSASQDNIKNRRFRTLILDPIVLMHEWVASPRYKKFRSFVDMAPIVHEVGARLRRARRTKIDASATCDWNEVISHNWRLARCLALG